MDKEPVDKLRLPVDALEDVLIPSQVSAERPVDAYYGAKVISHARIDNLANKAAEPDGAALVDAGFCLALTRRLVLAPALQNDLSPSGEFDPYNYTYVEMRSEELNVHEVYTEQLQSLAESHSTADVLGYFCGRLEDWTTHIATGADLPEPSNMRLDDFVSMAEVLDIATTVLPQTEEAHMIWRERFNKITAGLSTLLMEHNKEGLGVAFGSLNQSKEWRKQFIPILVEKLMAAKAVESDSSYRHLYNYTAERLSERQLRDFLAQLPKEPTDPLFGSEVTISNDPDNPYMFERYEKGGLRWAQLSDGTRVHLPQQRYLTRTIQRYGTNHEHEVYAAQTDVDYDKLGDAEKTAVQTAIRIDDDGLLRTETMPEYKRVALWRDDDEDRLYTVVHRDGVERSMDVYPDHHGFFTSNTDRTLDFPVEHMETVRDGFLVTRYNGDHMYRATYRDAEVNFFGPDDVFANAFWIMGNPRKIWSKTDARMQVPSDIQGLTEARFAIVPIRFLKVLENKSVACTELEAEDRDFIRKLGSTGTISEEE